MFPPGSVRTTFVVRTLPDVLPEPDLLFSADLSNPTDNVDIGVGQASGQIRDDDRVHAAFVKTPRGDELVTFELTGDDLLRPEGLAPVFIDLQLGPMLGAPDEAVPQAPLVVPGDWATPLRAAPDPTPLGQAPEAVAAPELLLASGEAFPDALASGPLQASRFLATTRGDQLSPVVEQILSAVPEVTVRILGGPAAVGPQVEEAITLTGRTVQRTFGASRLETAVAIAELVPDATTMLLVRAFGAAGGAASAAFADALAVGAWAADEGYVVGLTETDRLSAPTRDFLLRSGIEQVIVVGGTAAISDDVLGELVELEFGVRRVAGATRDGTAAAIAQERMAAMAAEDREPRFIVVEGFAEGAFLTGFSAASAGASGDAVVLLSNGDDLGEFTRQMITGFAGSARRGAGGAEGVLGACIAQEAACDEAFELLGIPADTEATVIPEEAAPGEEVTLRLDRLAPEDQVVEVTGDCLASPLVVETGGQEEVLAQLELSLAARSGLCLIEPQVRHRDHIRLLRTTLEVRRLDELS